MEIKINLQTDSSNTGLAGQAKITADGPFVRIQLDGPDRSVMFNAEDLLKVLSVLF